MTPAERIALAARVREIDPTTVCWCEGTYDEVLYVRRCKPDAEPEPGVAVRITVSFVPESL